MIEQSRRAVEDRKALLKKRNKIDLCVCVEDASTGQKNTNLWSKDPPATLAESTVRGCTVNGQSVRAEEMKLMMESTYREFEEDCDDSEHSNNESCVSMCESFSFLSAAEKKRPYGVIR